MDIRAIYLDGNATAPVKPAAALAAAESMAAVGNPASVHGAGRQARRRLDTARRTIADAFGAAPGGVIFTSGGTEANNLALAALPRRRLLVSAIEHDSIRVPAGDAGRIPVDGQGLIDRAALVAALDADPRPTLLSVQLANNETGVIQDLPALAALAHQRGALVHSDATQAPGRIAVDFAASGADLMTLSAHKFGGPAGAGALLVRDGLDIAPLIQGGAQEDSRRAGSPNLPGIAGFAAAAEGLAQDLARAPALAAMRDRMEAQLRDLAPDLVVFSAQAPRLPNTSCLAMPGVDNETQLIALDLAGIAVSAGAACASGRIGVSRTLLALGVSEATARSAIRVSLTWATTADDIDRLVAAWGALYTRTRRRAAA